MYADSVISAAAFAPVLGLLVERLELAPEIAAAKWLSGQPLTDAARERIVIDAAVAAAERAGADPDYVAAVFSDQIAAAKQVQLATFDAWSSGAASPPVVAPDLATQIRPALDRITGELVPALAAVQAYRGHAACAAAVERGLGEAAPGAEELSDALRVAVAHLCD